ncbi:MAG: aminodeoxychorismate/anthranilate synthase component II [Candidatus Bathyarchaeota archaeon]|nr:aminodeoxychorismate/anthranilate synthase component II [Candidatus Bathyarchaeota archaeon]
MKTLIIDNYDSFVYNLVQYVGELEGNPIVVRNDQITLAHALQTQPDRIIISPGPGTPENPRYFGINQAILQTMSRTTPTLGVCLGCQGIVHTFGGHIIRAQHLMHGKTSQIEHDENTLFQGIKNPLRATRYHSLVAERDSIPSCLEITAQSLDDHEIMGIRHTTYPIEGIQFHPESIMTQDGRKIIHNFLFREAER